MPKSTIARPLTRLDRLELQPKISELASEAVGAILPNARVDALVLRDRALEAEAQMLLAEADASDISVTERAKKARLKDLELVNVACQELRSKVERLIERTTRSVEEEQTVERQQEEERQGAEAA